jgi:hypothetical protein
VFRKVRDAIRRRLVPEVDPAKPRGVRGSGHASRGRSRRGKIPP